MRELTQQEIDDAPEWAVSYTILVNIITWYPSEDKQLVVMPYAKPIPRKEFDISEYEFSDSDIAVVSVECHRIKIRSNFTAGVSLSSRDATAISKHFKQT